MNGRKKKYILCMGLMCLLVATAHAGDQLGNEAVYQRCYRQITSQVPPKDSRLSAVISGTKDPISACLEVLDLAKISGSPVIKLQNTGAQALAVLSTLHYLHTSWFENRDYPQVGGFNVGSDYALYDISTPAAYYTRALFDPSNPVRGVLESSENLRVYRRNNDPASTYDEKGQKTDFVFGSATWLAGLGDILGFQITGPVPLVWNSTIERQPASGVFNFGETYGAGFLGTQPYMMMNVREENGFRSDGTFKMPRRWGRALFHDALCRELPVIRKTDAFSYVDLSAKAGFRHTTSCAACHASVDPASAVIRGFEYARLNNGLKPRAANHVRLLTPTKGNAPHSPLASNPDYAETNPNGLLYFRNYKGQLINESVSNLPELGQRIAAQDDFYICTAKRYYKYFTGIDVPTGDIEDPAHPPVSDADLAHRDLVIQLGLNLRSHQNPRRLIEEILRLSHYKDFSFSQK